MLLCALLCSLERSTFDGIPQHHIVLKVTDHCKTSSPSPDENRTVGGYILRFLWFCWQSLRHFYINLSGAALVSECNIQNFSSLWALQRSEKKNYWYSYRDRSVTSLFLHVACWSSCSRLHRPPVFSASTGCIYMSVPPQ